jgi:hypothetical protein
MKVVVYDRTCGGRWWRPGLTTSWRAGSSLYRALGRVDATFGAASWSEALDWIAARREPIDEIQYWGHGKWGRVLVGDDVLDARALGAGHALHSRLEAARAKLAPDALVWLRTCEAFGAEAGHDFARRLADFFRARVAGHTYIIGALQSGLHGLAPGATPDWPANEGIAKGTPAAPEEAFDSSPSAPRTITCFTGSIPPDWFA